MGQNPGNLIGSPVHPQAKTMIRSLVPSTQTSSVPQSIHGSTMVTSTWTTSAPPISPTQASSVLQGVNGPNHDNVHVHPDLTVPLSKPMITSTQTSSVPNSICGSTVSIHGPTVTTSTQTSSFPQSIHSPTVITATRRLPLRKPTAHITSYDWGSEHRLMAADVPRLPSLVFPCEANPDRFRYLFEFVWWYQLPLTQDLVQTMADIS